MIEQWLRGWVSAAAEQQPDLHREAAGYLGDRLRQPIGLTVTVHHRDLLARPAEGAGMTVAPARFRRSAARWWPWLRLLAVLVILAALVSLLGTKAFVAGLHVLTPGAMLAALGIGLATTVCNAMRWRLVAQRVGLRLPLADAITETYRATFLNAVLPGGVLGDVDRAFRHGRSSGDVARGARAVAIERTAGQLVVFVAALVVIPAEPALVMEVGRRLSRAPLLGFALVVAAVVLVAVLLARRANSTARRTSEPARWRRVLADTAADVRAGALARTAWPLLLLRRPPRWPATCCCS